LSNQNNSGLGAGGEQKELPEIQTRSNMSTLQVLQL